MNSKKSLIISIASTLFLLSLSLFLVYTNFNNRSKINTPGSSINNQEETVDLETYWTDTEIADLDVCEAGLTIIGCGDGIEQEGEECDDGNNIDGDGCNSDCTIPDICNSVCTPDIGCDGYDCISGFCRNSSCPTETDCICPDCPNGSIDPGETCDTDDLGDTSCSICRANCTCCGDGIEQAGEECDLGIENSETCAYGDTDCCTLDCALLDGPYCGDGVLQEGEDCDDGNNIDGDGCDADCTIPTECNAVCTTEIGCDGYDCISGYCRNPECSAETDCVCITCGDGNVDAGEECDDGNEVDDDGCTDCELPICNQVCTTDLGCSEYDCISGVCRNSSCSAETDCVCADCGDGNLDDGEECDDGNDDNDDGCRNDCTIPDDCDDVCTDDIGCDGDYVCYEGNCRNDACRTDSDCTCDAPKEPELPKAGGIPPTLIFTIGGIILVVLGLLF